MICNVVATSRSRAVHGVPHAALTSSLTSQNSRNRNFAEMSHRPGIDCPRDARCVSTSVFNCVNVCRGYTSYKNGIHPRKGLVILKYPQEERLYLFAGT